jgi:streptogramin lyase
VGILLATSVHAATLSGDLTSDGKPLRGALVTLISADNLTSETVLTDSSGHYWLTTQWSGALSLRARAPLSADATAAVTVPLGAAQLTQSFTLRRLTTPQEISDSLPASAHFSKIKFPTLIQREQFQTDCLSCHEIGNPLTRTARPIEAWQAFMGIMTVFAGYTSKVHVDDYAAAMNAAFTGKPIDAHENTTVDPEALTARITEWKLPTAKLAHDTEFYPPDGKFYTTDEEIDQFIVTDTKTNKSKVIPIPALGVPAGGNFTEHKLAAPFNQTNHHGVHSLQIGPDGLFYATAAIGGEILVYDPVHSTFKANKIGGMALYPHTLRIDSNGIVWFSIQMSNQMGRFDPKTGKTNIIELPTKMARKDERTPAPYGVDISPVDGSIWYTKLWANMIGRIDPVTFAVQEWEPPVIGPRRARFDKDGGLWIPGYGDGKIARLDTKTMKYETYQLPTLAADETEAPYALNIDPKTQDVWVSANQSDRMFRFVPKTKKFTAYPLPTRGVYFRDIVFTPDGRVCASNNPMPAQVVEGGMDSLICLEPDGNKHKT